MKCGFYKQGTCVPGTITATLEQGTTTVVIRQVPTQECDICGEDYVSEEIADDVLKISEQDVKTGVQVDIREYQATCFSPSVQPSYRRPSYSAPCCQV
jgi:YgiT-type zinc finger domain-containing protein